jgi:hypothetical protein
MMRDLRAGDEVLAVSDTGRLFYDRVVTFGAQEQTKDIPFTQLSLELLAGHAGFEVRAGGRGEDDGWHGDGVVMTTAVGGPLR